MTERTGTTTINSKSGSGMEASVVDLSELLTPVASEMSMVEEWLVSNLVDDSPFIESILQQIFKAGGKRIRPALVLLSSKATATPTGQLERRHIILSVLTELIHTASLVHDDVIDRADVRRGQETVNRKWNDKLAVLVGDLLFAQASICLARLMNPVIVGIYGQVLGDLCSGEIKQMNQQFTTSVDWDAYVAKSVCKTASLFAAGCHSGPILNNCPADTVGALKDYGRNLGICFQVADDLLDVTQTSEKLGKPAGSDLSQGLVTAPALFVLEGKDEHAARLTELIKTRAVSKPEGRKEALEIIRTTGGIDKTRQMIVDYAGRARQSLTIIPDSPYRSSLEGIIDYMVARTN